MQGAARAHFWIVWITTLAIPGHAGAAVLHAAEDHLHLRTGAIDDYPLTQVRAYLASALQPQFKFLCVNDLPQVEAAIPDTRAWIERAIAA